MYSVAFRRKADPDKADGIVGSRTDNERFVCLDSLELIFRIITIGRISIYRDDLERADRGGLFLAANRCGIKRNQFA